MPYSSGKSRSTVTSILLTLAISFAAMLFGSAANSQENVAPDAKAAPNFSRLAVKPANLAFKKLKFPAGPSTEVKSFTIVNTGKGTTSLNATVAGANGAGAAAYTILSGGGVIAPLLPGASATVTVQFQPIADGGAPAIILIGSDATRGAATHKVHLTGSAKGPIPATTPSATPSATPTPGGPVSTDKNSANAPGVAISGTTVTVYVPLGSDDNNTHGAVQVVVEGPSPQQTPALIGADRVNSCTPSSSGEVVCSGQGGSVDVIPSGGGSPIIQALSAGTVPTINFTTGDCMGCGAMVDDLLTPPLGIIASGLGYVPVDLSNNTLLSPIATNVNNADEAVGVNFGYDMAHHLILSANYTVDPNNNFAQTPPHFQIINISNPATPVVYELANDQAFLLTNNRTCNNGAAHNDKLPETTALDTSTGIAYVTFHTPSDCFGAPPNDIAMFDLSQAVFTNGTPNTWDTPAKNIQSITGTALNGIDPISVEAVHHLALVSAGDSNFGVLQLPSSGADLTISDWVNAQMPNDPDNVAWAGWHQPNGLATYVSPTTGKVMGVLMNNQAGGSTYLAIVNLDDLLNPALTARDPSPGNGHKVDGSVDLVGSGIVRFVKVQ